jgi:hypothetical protein
MSQANQKPAAAGADAPIERVPEATCDPAPDAATVLIERIAALRGAYEASNERMRVLFKRPGVPNLKTAHQRLATLCEERAHLELRADAVELHAFDELHADELNALREAIAAAADTTMARAREKAERALLLDIERERERIESELVALVSAYVRPEMDALEAQLAEIRTHAARVFGTAIALSRLGFTEQNERGVALGQVGPQLLQNELYQLRSSLVGLLNEREIEAARVALAAKTGPRFVAFTPGEH